MLRSRLSVDTEPVVLIVGSKPADSAAPGPLNANGALIRSCPDQMWSGETTLGLPSPHNAFCELRTITSGF